MSSLSVAMILQGRIKSRGWRRDGCDASLVSAESGPANGVFEAFLFIDKSEFQRNWHCRVNGQVESRIDI